MHKNQMAYNHALRLIHTAFLVVAIGMGIVLVMSLGPVPPQLPLGAAITSVVIVGLGYTYASIRIGDDSRLDPEHLHWAKMIRRNGAFIVIAAVMTAAITMT